MKKKRDHDKELRNIKWIPIEYSGNAAYIIYGNRIAIWNVLSPRIVVIEDQVIVDFFKTVFELVWDKLE